MASRETPRGTRAVTRVTKTWRTVMTVWLVCEPPATCFARKTCVLQLFLTFRTVFLLRHFYRLINIQRSVSPSLCFVLLFFLHQISKQLTTLFLVLFENWLYFPLSSFLVGLVISCFSTQFGNLYMDLLESLLTNRSTAVSCGGFLLKWVWWPFSSFWGILFLVFAYCLFSSRKSLYPSRACCKWGSCECQRRVVREDVDPPNFVQCFCRFCCVYIFLVK